MGSEIPPADPAAEPRSGLHFWAQSASDKHTPASTSPPQKKHCEFLQMPTRNVDKGHPWYTIVQTNVTESEINTALVAIFFIFVETVISCVQRAEPFSYATRAFCRQASQLLASMYIRCKFSQNAVLRRSFRKLPEILRKLPEIFSQY